MAVFTDLINSQYRAEYVIALVRQEVTNNRSLVRRRLQNRQLSGSGHFTFSGYPWSCTGGGNESGTYLYDFTDYDVKVIHEDEVWINHDADGTKTVTFTASVSMGGPLGGTGNPSGSVTLPTIPRATQPSVDGPLTLQMDGGSMVISMPRASSSFRHRVRYKFGDRSGTLATDVGTSFTWTTTTSLLSELPDSTTGTGTILVDTYSGDGDLIGTKTVPFRINVGSEIKPSIGGLTLSEAVPAVASAVGAYVQGQSRLAYAITDAAGAFGSTITAYKLTVAGQTLDGATGTTAALAASGTVEAVATVTDTRGRTATRKVSVTVLPWEVPQITLLRVQRSQANGTLDDNGTHLKFTVIAAVSSLVVAGAQKNTLTYRVRTKQKGATVWSSSAPTAFGGVALSATFVVGTFSELLAWDARFEVSDLFATSAAQALVSVGAVLLDIGPGGTGVGKRWEQGALDVAGDIYVRGHKLKLSASGRVTIAPSAPDTATSAVVTLPAGMFTDAPDVVSGVSSPNATVGTSGVTPTGFTVTIKRDSTTNTVVTWQAE